MHGLRMARPGFSYIRISFRFHNSSLACAAFLMGTVTLDLDNHAIRKNFFTEIDRHLDLEAVVIETFLKEENKTTKPSLKPNQGAKQASYSRFGESHRSTVATSIRLRVA